MSKFPLLREQLMKVEHELTTRISAGRETTNANGLHNFDEQRFIDWLQWVRFDPSTGIDLVDEQERLKGFVIFSLAKGPENIGQIDLLWCHADVRRKGFGRTLLNSAVVNLYELGASAMRLSVGVTNIPAQNLYERTGWTRTVSGRGYYVYERQPETLSAG